MCLVFLRKYPEFYKFCFSKSWFLISFSVWFRDYICDFWWSVRDFRSVGPPGHNQKVPLQKVNFMNYKFWFTIINYYIVWPGPDYFLFDGECMGLRHTVVCRAAQEAGCEYIDRKNNNAIFTYMHLRAAFTKLDNFCCRDALHHQYPTFQLVTKSRQASLRSKLSIIGLVSSFFFLFFFSSRC